MKVSTSCPAAQELQRLVDGSLPAERQEECLPHIDHCTGCQQKLEDIATDGTNLSQVIQHLHEAQPMATSAYWPALHAITEGALAQTQDAVGTVRTRDLSLKFLRPATDPAYLGRIGHFDVMRVLGRGGMGVVLEAFDSHLQRNVALKVLDPDLSNDDTAKQRFCREARAAASITHENVVAVHQVQKAEGGALPFMVMQLISGETLEQRLAREKKLSVREIVRIGMQAARGLAAAHAQGLVHRDIKPGNILLESQYDRVKLTDFGLARVAEDLKLTRTGFVSGTPLYMAPEQARGEQTDPRSDLFGLGAIMYEMSTGQTPFKGDSALSVLRQITEVKHRPLREIEPNVPEWLADLIDELLAKKPEDRYQTATDVAEVLEYHWVHMQASSEELPAVCQVEIRQRRRRTQLTIAVIGATLLALGLVAGSFLSNRDPLASAEKPVAVLSANAGTVWSVAFDPTGETLAMGVEDGSERLWNVSTQSVKATLEAHRGVVWSSQFSPDGKFLATAGDDGLLKLWRINEAEPFRVFQHPNGVRGLALSRDGQTLFTGDRQGGLHVWSADQQEALLETKQSGGIYALALTCDGETLATAGSDKIVRLWNAKTLTPRLPLAGHAGPINALSFDSDGKRLASVGWDKTVRIWDTGSGQLVKSWIAHPGDVWTVAFSPDGKQLATAGQEGAVKLWDPATGDLEATYLGHTSTVHALAFNQDGSRLASGGRDGSARVWKVR
jgi:serine/threonine protein kinase